MTDLPNGQQSKDESRQAEAQGAFIRPSTQDFLKRVGITSGMRVLVVGGDIGELTLLIAEMVGPSGEIIAADRAEAAVSTAAARAQANGIANARVLQRDLDHLADLASDRPFDAVVSRLGLVYHPKPAEALRNLIRLVRPGGMVGFQEVDLAARYWSTHKLEMLERFYDYIDQIAEGNQITRDLSLAMVEAFDGMGITERRIIRSGATENSPDPSVYAWIGTFARTLAAAIDGPTSSPPDFGKTFEARLRSEVESKGATFIPFHFIGAAGRLPAPSPDAARS